MNSIDFINTASELSEKTLIENEFNLLYWGIIIFNLICIAIAKTLNPAYLSNLFYTSIFNRLLLQNSQEDLKLKSIGSLLLTLVYFNSVAIVITLIKQSPINLLVIEISVAIIIVALFKFAIMRSLSYISLQEDGVHEHYLNHLVFYQIAGIILTTLLIVIPFIPIEFRFPYLIGIISIIGFLIFIREVQSFIRAIKLRISLFYIILYLCTLELLPLVLIIYTLVSNIEEFN